MTRKTPADFASWAALPMAHTSKIEGRLTMILDSTRRRTLPRRAFVLGAALTAAALVPLAMLRPAAEAQTTIARAEPIQLLGIVDAMTPNGNEWGADGKPLPAPVFRSQWGPGTEIMTKPGQKALFFVFHLSKSLQHTPVLYDVSGTTRDGLTLTRLGNTPGKKIGLLTETMQSIQMQNLSGVVTYGVALPTALASANFLVGVASA